MNKSWGDGDFNGDGVVNDIDATMMATNWQATSTRGAPESGVLALLLGLGAIIVLHRSRARLLQQ